MSEKARRRTHAHVSYIPFESEKYSHWTSSQFASCLPGHTRNNCEDTGQWRARHARSTLCLSPRARLALCLRWGSSPGARPQQSPLGPPGICVGEPRHARSPCASLSSTVRRPNCGRASPVLETAETIAAAGREKNCDCGGKMHRAARTTQSTFRRRRSVAGGPVLREERRAGVTLQEVRRFLCLG